MLGILISWPPNSILPPLAIQKQHKPSLRPLHSGYLAHRKFNSRHTLSFQYFQVTFENVSRLQNDINSFVIFSYFPEWLDAFAIYHFSLFWTHQPIFKAIWVYFLVKQSSGKHSVKGFGTIQINDTPEFLSY